MALTLRYVARSEVGLVRKNNQDSAYASPSMLMVADGMGGAAAVDLASAVAINELRETDADFTGQDMIEVATGAMPTSVVWYVQIVVIVAAHVVAVVLAHRHLAGRSVPEREARRSEMPWLVAMVGYTMLSLWLLAQPLMEQLSPPGQS